MAEKKPAFQFYPKDFLTDEKVSQMSNTEVGVYTRLLCHCWLEGTLPLETEALAHFARMPLKQFTKVWENALVRSCFHVGEDGRLHQKRLDAEREKQTAFKRRQSDNGAKGGRPRKDVAFETESQNNPSLSSAGFSEKSSSLSDLHSPISDLQPSGSLSRARVVTDDDLGERARTLLEHYAEWYSELRHGARLRLLRNSLEFQDALDLCALWPDERLEKLAKIVLTTDDSYISTTDRGFKIFARKASWADERLSKWERSQVSA